jgi:hypothetical protein
MTPQRYQLSSLCPNQQTPLTSPHKCGETWESGSNYMQSVST